MKLRTGDRSRGQTFVIFAILLPLLLLFLAFVVDAGKAFVDQRHLQNAADAASLAAAQELTGASPGCAGVADCTTRHVAATVDREGSRECVDASGTPIHAYIGSDPPDSRTCYQWPYYDKAGNPHQDQVLVWLYDCGSTWFGSFIGISQLRESVRSVSKGSTAAVIGTTTILGTTIPPSTSTSVSTGTTVIAGNTTTFVTTVVTTYPGTTNPGTTITGTTTYPGLTDPGNSTLLSSVSTVFTPGGGVGFAKSTACPAITYNGAGAAGIAISGLETNGGVLVGNNAVINGLQFPYANLPPSNSGCYHVQGSGSVTGASMCCSPPVDWPLPIPDPPRVPPSSGVVHDDQQHPVHQGRTPGGRRPQSRRRHQHRCERPIHRLQLCRGHDQRHVNEREVLSGARRERRIRLDRQRTDDQRDEQHDQRHHVPWGSRCGQLHLFYDRPPAGGLLSHRNNRESPVQWQWPDVGGLSIHAPNISTSGNGNYYCPGTRAADGTCNNFLQTLFDAYVGNLSLQGQNGTASGNMFAPNSNADIQGGGVGAGSGYIEAQNIGFHGNFASFKGTGAGSFTTSTTPITIPGTTNPGSVSTFTNTVLGTTDPGSTGSVTTNQGTTLGGTTSTTVSSTEITIPGTTTPDSTQTVTSGTTTSLNIHE